MDERDDRGAAPDDSGTDGDFAPPTVTQQLVIADEATGDVTLSLNATDASGVREILSLVYADDDGVPGGTGRAVPYSTGNIAGTAGPHTLLLPGALGKLISIQYIDGAGNLLLKSLKGKLFEAIPVEIRTSVLSVGATTTIVVYIGDFEELEAPVLTVDFGDGTSAVYPLVDESGNPTAIVQVQPDGSAIATVSHDYANVSSATVVATVSAQGAGGSDSATLTACSDPLGDFAVPAGDIVACSFASQGTRVRFGLFMAGAISFDYQYRVKLPQLGGGLLKYNNGSAQGPSGAGLVVSPSGANGLLFDFDAGAFGWNGVSAISLVGETQTGLPGGQQVGSADETSVLVFTP